MDLDITLIVKASNQQFEDQTIKCEPSWTIRRLKSHLTEVYPGKPSTDEQKLIYSGQLLGDSIVLKDILRHYDGQKTHTVHLVFTPKNNRFQKEFSYASGSSSSSSASNRNMPPKVNETTVPAGSGSSSSSPMPAGSDIGADGLRQRNVGQNSGGTAPAPVATGCPTTPATNNFMEHHLAMQNLMQQAYMQYLNQYMNVISGQTNAQALYASAPTNLPATPATAALQPQSSIQTAQAAIPPQPIIAQTLPNLAYYPYLPTMNSPMPPMASSIPAPITSSGTIPTSSSASASAATPAGPSSQPLAAPSPAGPSTSPQVAAAPQPAGTSATDGTQAGQTATVAPQVDNANAAPGGAAGGAAAGAAPAAARRFPNIVVEEQENRDWLDIFFSLCRVGILMTVVYLYSSPVRCLTVLFIGIALYLYQIGFFRTNDPMERARRIVVQEINNAHGIRQNAALRARVARQVAAAAAVGGAAAAAPAGQQVAEAAEPNAASPAGETADQTDSAKAAAPSTPEGENNPVEATADGGETAQLVEAVEAGQTGAVPEANRVNINDVAGFLRTLVLSFFTSIIPDTPAA
ncbi:hypothetical protein quinque_010751 [Culex quinquefasciatus]